MTGIPTYKQFKHYAQQQSKDAYNDYVQGIVSTQSIYTVTILNIFGLSLKLKDWTIVVLELLKVMAKFMGPIPSHR